MYIFHDGPKFIPISSKIYLSKQKDITSYTIRIPSMCMTFQAGLGTFFWVEKMGMKIGCPTCPPASIAPLSHVIAPLASGSEKYV